MTQPERYEYPLLYKIIANVMPVAMMMVVVLLLLLPWQDGTATVDPVRYTLIAGAVIPFALVFAVSIHFMYPALYIMDERFKLKTGIYESDWIKWEKIKRVRLPDTRLTAQIYAISVPGIHPIYWIIGLSQGLFSPGFLIHPHIHNSGRLLQTFFKKRPDLFPVPPDPKRTK